MDIEYCLNIDMTEENIKNIITEIYVNIAKNNYYTYEINIIFDNLKMLYIENNDIYNNDEYDVLLNAELIIECIIMLMEKSEYYNIDKIENYKKNLSKDDIIWITQNTLGYFYNLIKNDNILLNKDYNLYLVYICLKNKILNKN